MVQAQHLTQSKHRGEASTPQKCSRIFVQLSCVGMQDTTLNTMLWEEFLLKKTPHARTILCPPVLWHKLDKNRALRLCSTGTE
mmetsp:Transcript_43847/g.115708  ORF Transcript_43847/g.115708 Transcript_43847/m.115708 type:complete len:83 (-) Transcript_43847:188-436(-)